MEKQKVRNIPAHRRLLRLIVAAFDPRAYIHMIRIMNYYNHTHVIPRRKIRMGRDCAISPDVSFQNGEHITLRDRVKLASRCHIWAGSTSARIVIDDDTVMGPEVLVTTSNYRFNDGSPVSDQNMDERDVHIGRDVWIGARAMILSGVTIGNGAIIGGGAIVISDIPPGGIAVGAPARVVGQRTPVYPEPGAN